MSGHDPPMVPVFHPTREEFQVPFCEYVRKVFRKYPDLAAFKVVPPKGWRARKQPFPDLRKVKINVPIRQHVFGTKGAYRCLFMEQKEMSVAEFKLTAEEEAQALRGEAAGRAVTRKTTSSRSTSARHHRPPLEAPRPADADEAKCLDPVMERAFWANVTLNPPMYGADTPTSFFDEKLTFGWNLNNLNDLLKAHDVDDVPGVTTPMTYFGMWRSFFGWHKEDADLMSVNYMHWGAPKIWYCVPPSARHKFERMAQTMFPELHKACPAFVRHKDIMLSPSLLRTYGVPYVTAQQNPNEFIVLNAAAYHAGFNAGFNCAEAVNFALKEWIPYGKEATPCRCSALKDAVHISMKIFDPKWKDPWATDSSSSDDEEESDEEEEEEEGGSASKEEEEATSGSGDASQDDSDSSSDSSDEDDGDEEGSSSSDEEGQEQEEEQEQEGEEEEEEEEEQPPAKKAKKAAAAPPKKAAARQMPAKKAPVKKAPAKKAPAKKPRAPAGAQAGKPAATGRGKKAAEAAGSSEKPKKARTPKAKAAGAAPAGKKAAAVAKPEAKKRTKAADKAPAAKATKAKAAAAKPKAVAAAAAVSGAKRKAQQAAKEQPAAKRPRPAPASRAGAAPKAAPAAAQAAAEPVHAGAAPAPAVLPIAALTAADVTPTAQELPKAATSAATMTIDATPPPAPVAQPPAPTPAACCAPPAATSNRPMALAVKPRSSVALAAMALKAKSEGVRRPTGQSGDALVGEPMAICGQEANGGRFFYLVQRLAQPASSPGCVALRWLKEGRDGLFRPVEGAMWEEAAGALVPVHTTQAAAGENGSSSHHAAASAWQLLTPKQQLLEEVDLRSEL